MKIIATKGEITKKENKFSCPICNQIFSQRGHLNVHVTVVHEEKRSHKCMKCKPDLNKKNGLDYHVKTFHDMDKKVWELLFYIYSKGTLDKAH